MALTKYSFTITVFLSIILLSTPITMTTFAQQPENKIPDWIKNNAEWWADGLIDGDSFIQGIQYLIKEDVIIIPETTQGTSSGTNEIPSWIKNNVGWWADGTIDESSFVSSMQFLIENGVVQISSTTQETTQETRETTPEQNITTPQDTQTDNTNENNAKPKTNSPNENNKNIVKDKTKRDFLTIDEDQLMTKSAKIKNNHDKMMQKANTDGNIRVVVELFDSKPNLTVQEKIERKQNLKNELNSFKNTLSPDGIISSKNFEFNPFIAMIVTPSGLDELISSGMVKSISQNMLAKTTLGDSVPQIGANVLHGIPQTGAGTYVAILDTGVQSNHDFFMDGTSKVHSASEACFNGGGMCPNESTSQTGEGSARPCGPTDDVDDECKHGTHVAGIAAGNDLTSEPSGVAPDAGIVAVSVFTYFGPGNIGAFFGDITFGLEHVLKWTNNDDLENLNIVSVNLSLGTTGAFASTCDDFFPAVTSAMKDLREAGVAVVVSSGNGAFANGLSWPACITHAISVGSVDKSDNVPVYSNEAIFLDLLAVGGTSGSPFNGVSSSVAHESDTDKFDSFFGTSMAAPHVTGAFALLHTAVFPETSHPTPSDDEILVALKASGVQILEPFAGLTKPRIDLTAALDFFELVWDVCGMMRIDDFSSARIGTSGNDIIGGTAGPDLIFGLGGDDDIGGYAGDDCLFGGPGADKISGGLGDDLIFGGDDDDSLRGDEGADIIFGEGGNDRISGGPNIEGFDVLWGGPGNDSLMGRGGPDILHGEGGSDILDGGEEDDSADTLNGGEGDDFLYGRGGVDTLDGGTDPEGGDMDWCIGGGDGDTILNCEFES